MSFNDEPVGDVVAETAPQVVPLDPHHRQLVDTQTSSLQMLARVLSNGPVLGFVGSGLSCALGHVGWADLARGAADAALTQAGTRADVRADFLRKLHSAMAPNVPQSESQDRILLCLSEAASVLSACADSGPAAGGSSAHPYDAIAKLAMDKPRAVASTNPIELVVERLGIKRFLTINYDLEIECALKRSLGCCFEGEEREAEVMTAVGAPTRLPRMGSPVLTPRARSLTTAPDRPEDLTLFGVGAPGYECGVFHCHGVATQPDTMIVTEADYQNAYVRSDSPSEAYRDSLALALGANAVVFLGVGLREPDLLYPLRKYVAEHRGDRERPLFALLREPSDSLEAMELALSLYDRYGLKVLYYKHTSRGPTDDFLDAISWVAEYKERWWDSWQRRPEVRQPAFCAVSPERMIHHRIQIGETFEQPAEVLDPNAPPPEAVLKLVLGGTGAGKGNMGARLAERMPLLSDGHKGGYTKTFYATTHFSNDFLSMVEAAATHFGAPPEGGGSADDRLERQLLAGRYLLVIGGVERLLREIHEGIGEDKVTSQPIPGEYKAVPIGRPLTSSITDSFEMLIRVVSHPDCRSHVVLTSSLWPDVIHQRYREDALFRRRFECLRMGGIDLKDFVDKIPLTDPRLPYDLIADVHRALRGHTFALRLVLTALRDSEPGSEEQWFRKLFSGLTRLGYSERASYLVGEAIGRLQRDPGASTRFVLPCLVRVALFTTPVGYEEVQEALTPDFPGGEADVDSVRNALETLVNYGLLEKVKWHPDRPGEPRYTAHSVVRSHILPPGHTHRFVLPGFAEQGDEVQPALPDAHTLATACVDALLARAERETVGQPAATVRPFIRGGFAILRGRWNAVGVARMGLAEDARLHADVPHYDAHLARIGRLANVIRKNSRTAWLYREGKERTSIETEAGMLYVDELAWTANELALVSFMQGSLHDASAWFRAGEHIHAVAERGTRGRRWCQSEMNIGVTQLEMGSLSQAEYHLRRALDEASRLDRDEEMAARARGYLGMVAHLSADFVRADRLYKRALRVLKRYENHRGTSIFRRLRADLLRADRRLDAAWQELRLSASAAELGNHPDLLHFTRVAIAHVRGSKHPSEAQADLTAARHFAARVGAPKLEVDASKVMASLALEAGDLDRAERLTRRGLSIAAAHGMGLRVTSALFLLARITEARGLADLAQTVHKAAAAQARQQGYYLQLDKAALIPGRPT